MRVLLVEDEKLIALYYKKVLGASGIDVRVAHTGEDAVRLAAMEPAPDLLLMDINLEGGIDGIEACSRIKQAADIPVVYVTAYSDQDTRGRAALTNPAAYLIKPVDPPTLLEAIRRATGIAGAAAPDADPGRN
ncbi:response regulator receiver protein [Desulfovibrio sp. X2]|uniref:response regulator n=1 Tax=Desulfovibrio sp. X2 TaxID=941449 RepID=UPI000358CFA5|nr:response regulator [Desulfovibrio sp. X2]EPR44037.1 response regulator receiver protein [Desulfovibrio sp. X2]